MLVDGRKQSISPCRGPRLELLNPQEHSTQGDVEGRAPLPPLTPLERSFYLTVVGVTTVAGVLGFALLPLLVTTRPEILLASAADLRNIVLVSAKLDMAVVLAIGLPRRWIGMLGSYGLGTLYGEVGIAWIEKRLPRAGRLGRWLLGLYARFPRLMLLVVPAYWTSFLAGSMRLPQRSYLLPMFMGQIAFVTGAYFVGAAADTWMTQLIEFFRVHLFESTAVFVSVVGIQQLLALRRRRRRLPEAS